MHLNNAVFLAVYISFRAVNGYKKSRRSGTP